MIEISVIVPFFNEEQYLDECLQALLAQDYPSDTYEIILVDNNSTDRSVEIVKRYPHVKLFHMTVQGDYAARNLGIEQASGAILAFTDADTAPQTDWLRQIERAMQAPEVQLIVGRLHYASDTLAFALIEAYEFEKAVFTLSGENKDIYYAYTCNMAVRRSLFESLGPFPPVFRNADIVFLRRVLDAYTCRSVRFAPDVRVRRLEFDRLGRYYGKHHLYGRDYRRYSKVATLRPLNSVERLAILRNTIVHRRYSFVHSALLVVLLVIGVLCYESGRWVAFGR